ncbi:protein kinase [Streptomyces sp. NPDC000594]|uniref:protein kinase domain-containing protein n=1 Tax=Streptomyces sp. NPDC000594 TaxID=3154261 RepID=UPI00331E59FE
MTVVTQPPPPTEYEPDDHEPAAGQGPSGHAPPTEVEVEVEPDAHLTEVEPDADRTDAGPGADRTDVEPDPGRTDVEPDPDRTDVEPEAAGHTGVGGTDSHRTDTGHTDRTDTDRADTGHPARASRTRRPVPPRGDTGRLPRSLSHRFRLLAVVRRPAHRHQAAVLRVTDATGLTHVLKWYDHEHAPEPRVWELLSAPHPHLARFTETDPTGADGHPYDLVPSYGETDLATYLKDNPGPVPAPFVTGVVRQLHRALTTLHELGLVHRDVSPANVVLGRLDPADPELTLVDFGVSAYAPEERSARGTRWVGTMPYMSPQSVLRHQMIHPPGDWWSLGMIAAEMAGGRHPIPYTTPEMVQEEIASRGIDLRRVTDTRLALLCQGLLTRDPDHRWGSGEVARWLAGDSPQTAPWDPGAAPPVSDPSLRPGVEPFLFLGEPHTRPQQLARAFSENWRAAVRTLGKRDDREGFTNWLRQFGEAPGHDRTELNALIGLLAERAPRPATLVRLISWLGPALDASYRGVPIDRAGLTELADLAVRGDEFALDVVNDLREHTLLPLLDHRPGGDGLRGIDRDWIAALSHWENQVDEAIAQAPSLRAREREIHRYTALTPVRRAALLALVASPTSRYHRLAERAARTEAALPRPVAWYSRLIRDRDGAEGADGRIPVPELVRLQLADLLAGEAERASWQAQNEIEQEAALRGLLADEDAAARWVRRQDTLPTLGWALAGALMLVIPWLLLIGLGDLLGRPSQPAVVRAWMLAVPGAVATVAIELWTAYRIGAPAYHPDRSVAGLLIDRALPFARFVRQPGSRFPVRGLLLLLPLALMWLTVMYLPWLWPALTVAGLAGWSVWRLYGWQRLREEVRSGAGGNGGPPAGPTGPAGPRGPGGPAGPAGGRERAEQGVQNGERA